MDAQVPLAQPVKLEQQELKDLEVKLELQVPLVQLVPLAPQELWAQVVPLEPLETKV